MTTIVDTLADNPLLLAFLTIAIGGAVGSLSVRGVSLGPAAALFAGLALGAIDDELSQAEGLALLQGLGLVLFTYTLGLASGPTFVNGVRRGGARALALTVGLVVLLCGLVVGVGWLFDLSAADRAGVFAGSSTNTPALQAALDGLPAGSGDPVVGYSLTYPLAVLAMIVVQIQQLRPGLPAIVQRVLHSEPPEPEPPRPVTVSRTVRVTRDDLPSLADLRTFRGEDLAFSRYEHDGQVQMATSDVVLVPGDLVVVIGVEPTVAAFTAWAGEAHDRHLALDRRSLDYRRVAVSNRALAGERLGDLDLLGRFGATVSRVRRGDQDLVATEDLRLELGDRVRVVAPTDQLPRVATYFGDSYRSLGEFDVIGLALGIALGLALGLVEVPLPGGGQLSLGLGGGPLVAGLVLGVLGRTGPVTWQIPYGSNLTLRQVGILAFLACVGLRSGTVFWEALGDGDGLRLIVAGALTAGVFAAAVALGVRFLHQSRPEQAGMLAGVETQPAALAFASQRTDGDERVSAAYALVFPVAMIAKVIAVQLLV